MTRFDLGAAMVVSGALASLHSLRETASHVRDEAYHGLDVAEGPGHVRYHLGREALTTAGAMGTAVALATRHTRAGRAPLLLTVGGYLAGLWSGKALAGSWAPTGRALAWHVGTSVLLLGGALIGPSSSRR